MNLQQNQKMVVSDLDGTLFNSDERISERDIQTLKQLGDLGHIRVIATGRSLFSAIQALPVDLPLDFLVCSTGAAVFNWKSRELIRIFNLGSPEINQVLLLLSEMKLDFILQEAVPENHKCFYFQYSESNPDLERRNRIYEKFVQKLDLENNVPSEACQFIVIVADQNAIEKYNYIKQKLKGLNVIRSTSPLDHQSLWIEIYSAKVSKANGLNILTEMNAIRKENLMVIGNDYNDLDMLKLTKHSFTVGNAPEEMRQEFRTVVTNNDSGFSEAVDIFLNGV